MGIWRGFKFTLCLYLETIRKMKGYFVRSEIKVHPDLFSAAKESNNVKSSIPLVPINLQCCFYYKAIIEKCFQEVKS